MTFYNSQTKMSNPGKLQRNLPAKHPHNEEFNFKRSIVR
jgi:hypothetical protein